MPLSITLIQKVRHTCSPALRCCLSPLERLKSTVTAELEPSSLALLQNSIRFDPKVLEDVQQFWLPKSINIQF